MTSTHNKTPEGRYQYKVLIEHYFAATYHPVSGRRIGLAVEGPKITKLLVIGRPIKVLKLRGKERGYVKPHKHSTVESWVSFINGWGKGAERLGITKEAEAMVAAAKLQLEVTQDGKHTGTEAGSTEPSNEGRGRGKDKRANPRVPKSREQDK